MEAELFLHFWKRPRKGFILGLWKSPHPAAADEIAGNGKGRAGTGLHWELFRRPEACFRI